MTDDRPIAWLALKEGTPILASDGTEVGRVTTVVADEQNDIFSGVAFRPGLLDGRRFVPADAIDRLTEGAVHLKISGRAIDALEPY
ncbi:MAG: PRC-barrel domain-containing protein [Actinomycetota bacterium]